METSLGHLAADTGSLIQDIAWFVLFGPLIVAAATWVFTRRHTVMTAGFNIFGVVLSFLLSAILFAIYHSESIRCTPFHWLPLPGLDITIGLQLDRLSLLMMMVVTAVASLVMIFSTGYMRGDPGYSRFFCTLSLFVFSMLGIVLAENLVMMFIFWELVGFSSYLLIGFWYGRNAAADAAKKAFIVNRLGDFGFVLGIVMLWGATGTVNISAMADAFAKNPGLLGAWASLAGVLVFMGAMGKSAQFPLHVWLPDAMEGPTPVSALIHAATMVAAGVYMLCRVFFIYTIPSGWPDWCSFLEPFSAATLVAWVGGITSLIAALIALQQDDIKRILAYSTLSQLGYMVMAVGAAAKAPGANPSAAMYHLVTHAFFKALLFLCAGSVIHAIHHEQNIWKMGGLRYRMPYTFGCFVVGSAALMGLPLFSGFYSKDELLATVLEGSPVLFGLGIVVAVLTTLYMSRLVIVAFLGTARNPASGDAHESPPSMTGVLLALAVPSVMIAWLPIGPYLARHYEPGYESHGGGILFGPFNHNAIAALFGLGAVLFGLSVAYSLYWGVPADPLPNLLGRWARVLRKRFYFDEIYDAIFVPLHDLVAKIAAWIDEWLVSGLIVRGASGVVDLAGNALRLVQTGNLQTYAFLLVAGAAVLAYLALK